MLTRLTWTRSIYLVLVVALVLRVLAAGYWESRLDDNQKFRFGDSAGYWELASRVAHGQEYAYNSEFAKVFRAPGYPALLAPLFLVWDEPPILAARLLGCGLGVLSVWLVWLLGRQLFGRRAGWYAAWLVALYPGAIAISILVLAEALFVPLMLGQFLFTILAFRSKSNREFACWSILAAIFNGTACLTRPSWLFFLPFAFVSGVLFYENRNRQLYYFLISMIVTAGVMTPWWIRNYDLTGKFVLTTLQTGTSLYDGLNPEATGASDMRFAPRMKKEYMQEYLDFQIGPRNQFEYSFNELMKRRALDWARNHPVQVIQLAFRKLVRIWNPIPNSNEAGSRMMRWGIAAFFIPAIFLSVCGAWICRKRFLAFYICLVPSIYFSLLHMIFVGSIRYRQPPMICLLLLAGLMIAILLRKTFGYSRNSK